MLSLPKITYSPCNIQILILQWIKQTNPCLYRVYVLKSIHSFTQNTLVTFLLCASFARSWGTQWWRIYSRWNLNSSGRLTLILAFRKLSRRKMCTNSCNPNERFKTVLSEENFLKVIRELDLEEWTWFGLMSWY